MSTSKDELRRWFAEGVGMGATHMIVVCDTYDYEDYPVFVMPGLKSARQVADENNNSRSMTKVLEVYDLRMDREQQMAETRAFHY